ncbi:MAG: hypothetical protein A2Z31_06195 [candidate division NC10 bacterium RBG_16_65_8]|nr:MAG: hypothetical protein A2Z31_06195 [candidate division NC10 bacterium RBG_16_65_8]
MSARRSVVSGLSGRAGRPLGSRITLIALGSTRTHRPGLSLLAPEPGRALGSRFAFLTSGPWCAPEAGLALLASRPWRPLHARRARGSPGALRPGLALQIGKLLGQLADAGRERV